MSALKLIAVGNSTGMILPKELLARLHAERGDTLPAIKTEHGIELSPYDPDFHTQVEVATEVMNRQRNVLRKLAE